MCRDPLSLFRGLFMRAALLSALAALTLAASPVTAAPVTCQAFKADFIKAAADLQIDFVRPLVVSRGLSSADEVFDLVSQSQVDGSLRCRNDRLVRFEAKIAIPANEKLLERFARVQRAAVGAALKWPMPRVDAALTTMNQEAGEYLRASIERGDVYHAGKTEYHEGGSDLGMIWTPTDRAFIIVGD
jgi:hypothetical protein